jgi:Phage integrase, N-terminal SAM-like domain
MDQVREVLRYHHYAYRTEQTYGQWILRYLHHFGGKTHPNRLGAKDVERFLSHLATEGQVSASIQRHALMARLLYGGSAPQKRFFHIHLFQCLHLQPNAGRISRARLVARRLMRLFDGRVKGSLGRYGPET